MRRTLLVIAVLGLPGCGLDRPYPDTSYYVLEPVPRQEAAPGLEPTRVIRVPRAAVAPPFSSRALQYRVADNRFEPSHYHHWAGDPGALVAVAAAETLAATGRFVVVQPGSDVAGASTLELQVRTLSVDVTGPAPTVAVAVRATLLDGQGGVLLSRDVERRAPTASADAPEAVRALNAALQAALLELADEIAGPGS